MKRPAFALWVSFAIICAVSAQASSDGADVPAVQQALAPFQSLMARLPAPLRDRLLAHARAWVALTPEEQARLRENLMAWDELSPQAKLALRERFEAWEHLDDATRDAALAAMRDYARLPEASRRAWRERFDALPPEQRQRYRFDASTRAAMDLANDLFPFIPVEQHADTLAMLRALTLDQVGALRRHLARLPPGQRNVYRQKLLDMEPAMRVSELESVR
ncbi:DUF3106 domain-containing protein [Xanthomonadaceae bacterium JHOS43]|nr:DUF3106 domain-containing protein [Xanthomonadaceae bacterium JHOS43]